MKIHSGIIYNYVTSILHNYRGISCMYYVCTNSRNATTKRNMHTAYVINPRHTCAVRVTALGLCVCLLPRFLPPRTTNRAKTAPTGSVLHWLDFFFILRALRSKVMA